jgi:hypothetical protein
MSISAATDIVVSSARYYYLRNLKQGYTGCVDAKSQNYVVLKARDTVRKRSLTLSSSSRSTTGPSPVGPLLFFFCRAAHSRFWFRCRGHWRNHFCTQCSLAFEPYFKPYSHGQLLRMPDNFIWLGIYFNIAKCRPIPFNISKLLTWDVKCFPTRYSQRTVLPLFVTFF